MVGLRIMKTRLRNSMFGYRNMETRLRNFNPKSPKPDLDVTSSRFSDFVGLRRKWAPSAKPSSEIAQPKPILLGFGVLKLGFEVAILGFGVLVPFRRSPADPLLGFGVSWFFRRSLTN